MYTIQKLKEQEENQPIQMKNKNKLHLLWKRTGV